MKTLTYLFALLAGFWTVLYVSPFVFLAARMLQNMVDLVDRF